MPGVILRNVVKSFGETDVIHGVDIDVQEGEFCVLVGPSGCGKSTILRMIAGLENATDGVILIGSEDVTKTDPASQLACFHGPKSFPPSTISYMMQGSSPITHPSCPGAK